MGAEYVESTIANPGPLILFLGAQLGAALIAFTFGLTNRRADAFFASAALCASSILSALRMGAIPVFVSGAVEATAAILAASLLGYGLFAFRLPRSSTLIGALIIAACVSLVGLVVLNVLLAGGVSQPLSVATICAGVLTFVIALVEARNGHQQALAVVIGVGAMLSAPMIGVLVGGALDLGVLVFLLGALVAAGVSLPLSGDFRAVTGNTVGAEGGSETQSVDHQTFEKSDLPGTAETQLAQVLDYAGVAVLDWTPGQVSRSATFAGLMGATETTDFTPQALQSLIMTQDQAAYETEVIGAAEGDGQFDSVLRLSSGNQVRMRGARAISPTGEVERLILFLEAVPQEPASVPSSHLKAAAVSLTDAAAAGTRHAEPATEQSATEKVAGTNDAPAKNEKQSTTKKSVSKSTNDDASRVAMEEKKVEQAVDASPKGELNASAKPDEVLEKRDTHTPTMLFLGGRSAGRPLKGKPQAQKLTKDETPVAPSGEQKGPSAATASIDASKRLDADLETSKQHRGARNRPWAQSVPEFGGR